MWYLQDIYSALQAYMERGGAVLWVIMMVAFFLWMLIIERAWYIKRIAPKRHQIWLQEWQQRAETESWRAVMIRDAMIAKAKLALTNRLGLIKVLIALLPMLGLIGTVSGMIQVFDVMATLGTGNARAMASGISRATLPTMAGLVVSIAGLYFITRLQTIAREQTEYFRNKLSESVEP